MNDYQPWEFTCKTCGGHGLTVSRVWFVLAGSSIEGWQEWGPLKGNHFWQFKFKEKIEKETNKHKDDKVSRWEFGKDTKDSSSSKPGENKLFEQESSPAGHKFYVHCAGCDREIEFGWSHPNRGGRIFPVECSDFLPEEVWPDPKYVEVWRQRGWLRKGHTQP
jgi:hypothetical protein